jgi:hypothetical protein
VRVRERQEQRRTSSALVGERDLAKFDITVQGQIYRALNKRRAILIAARALVAAGVSPNDISSAAPPFVGALKADRAAEGRPFDSRRWFCAEDELIHYDGSTYAVWNQWGLRTKETLTEIVGHFPSAGVTVSDSEL